MKLVVSLDVEADNQWEHGIPLTTRNVDSWEWFQELCERHGVVPTYLLTTEIVADDRARELLSAWQARGAAEVGAHLHPWSTPPFMDVPGLRRNDDRHAFLSQLPDDLVREKVQALTRQIREAFGFTPTSFRAGRYGFDKRVAGCLAEAGYVVDTSVTPLVSWAHSQGMGGGTGGPDFTRFSSEPFRIAGTGDPGLLEIPVTVMQTYRVYERFPALWRASRWLPARAVRKILLRRWVQAQPMWLSPYPYYGVRDLALVWRRAEEAGLDVAVMKLHSSELMPGGSPYRPDAASIRDLRSCLDGFFTCVRRSGGGFASLTSAAAALAPNILKVREL
jgi:hypothetical protein